MGFNKALFTDVVQTPTGTIATTANAVISPTAGGGFQILDNISAHVFFKATFGATTTVDGNIKIYGIFSKDNTTFNTFNANISPLLATIVIKTGVGTTTALDLNVTLDASKLTAEYMKLVFVNDATGQTLAISDFSLLLRKI